MLRLYLLNQFKQARVNPFLPNQGSQLRVDPSLILFRNYGLSDRAAQREILLLKDGSSQSKRTSALQRRVAGTSSSSQRFSQMPEGTGSLLLRPSASLGTAGRRINESRVFPLVAGAPHEKNYNPALFFLGFSLSMLVAYVLKSHQDSSVYAEGESIPRGENIERLPSNDFQQSLKDLGLVEDRAHPGWYKLNSKNRFRVKETPGKQFIWRSFENVGTSDVVEVAKFYDELEEKRSLHINTGAHGKLDGTPVPEVTDEDGNKVGSGNFFLEDLGAFKRYSWVSFHTVSSLRSPITYEEIQNKLGKNIDVMDAWCNSAHTKSRSDYSRGEWREESNRISKKSVKTHELVNHFFSLDYLSQKRVTSEYEEPKKIVDGKQVGLITQIKRSLDEKSFCHVKGEGGYGKSRAAIEIEREIRQQIEEKPETCNYSNTVFIPLKNSSDETSFRSFVRQILPKGSFRGTVETNALEKYFTTLHQMAKSKGKRVLVIIDNIDNPKNDLKLLEEFYEVMKVFHRSGEVGGFDLLVTGRVPIDVFLSKNKLDSDGSIVELGDYKGEENSWNIFLTNFLTQQDEKKKAKAKVAVDKVKKELKKAFKKYGYHVGLTVSMGSAFGQAYALGIINNFQDRIELIDEYIAEALGGDGTIARLDDYNEFRKILDVPLHIIEKENPQYKGLARSVFDIFSLVSDIPTRYALLDQILRKCIDQGIFLENTNIQTVRRLISKEFLAWVLINEESKDPVTYSMPKFYNSETRKKLSIKYRDEVKEREKIDALISIALEVITSNKNNSDVEENIRHLVSLFGYSTDFGNYNELQEKISHAAGRYIAEKWKVFKYKEIDRLRSLFIKISRDPGFSIESSLYNFINEVDSDMEARVLMRTLSSHDCSFEMLKKANNFCVLNGSQKVALSELSSKFQVEQVRHWLKAYINRKLKNENSLSQEELALLRTINTNIENIPMGSLHYFEGVKAEVAENLLIFPEVKFHQIPEADRQLANDFISNLETQGIDLLNEERFNLSGLKLKEGLRLITERFLHAQTIEQLDLSNNQIGYADSGARAVRDLLTYSASLKVLDLSNNYLYVDDDSFDEIIRGLEKNLSLTKLILSENSLKDEHIEKLRHALEGHPTLETIELHHNQFTNAGVNQIYYLMGSNRIISKITAKCKWLSYHDSPGVERDGDYVNPLNH